MNEAWLAWLAGIVDGEGTVGLSRSNRKTKRHPYLTVTFHISNTNIVILNKAAEIIEWACGKKPYWVICHPSSPRCKVARRISIDSQKALRILLPKLLPYFVGKQEQALLVLDFCSRRSQRLHPHWYEFAELDQAAYQRSLALNKRGNDLPKRKKLAVDESTAMDNSVH